MGHDVFLDLNVETNGLPVCPDCLPIVAAREFEEVVRPAIRLGGDNAFEKACVVVHLRDKPLGWGGGQYKMFGLQDQLNRAQSRPTLVWTVASWSGRFVDGLSRAEFAHEFVGAAGRRGITSNLLRVGRSKIAVYTIMTVGEERGEQPSLYVATDGRTIYGHWVRHGGWSGKWEAIGVPQEAPRGAAMQIPVGAAIALRLAIPG